uniref:Uncharacterized protein n=1 Tax=Candidatus Kentrum sp. TUN TaxID=2126343 RepID=A0A450ZP27_9GAMM|nr:MAG: hypothetical protein BECKTUN1418F_GA0071002_10706 [Candidatus Kentron sp. TUN]VFK61640.1 MAG: hypothetical protein BECKTUN1418E_GA0071001_10696 [Candidatus Kentron sp. TUN]
MLGCDFVRYKETTAPLHKQTPLLPKGVVVHRILVFVDGNHIRNMLKFLTIKNFLHL